MSKPPDLLAVVPFRPVFHNRSKHNRLLERGRLSTPRSFKADQRFETVLELLLRSGYSNTAEVLFDCVFRRANELNPALCLPVPSDVADREQELQRQLAELKKTQAADAQTVKQG